MLLVVIGRWLLFCEQERRFDSDEQLCCTSSDLVMRLPVKQDEKGSIPLKYAMSGSAIGQAIGFSHRQRGFDSLTGYAIISRSVKRPG